MAFYESFKVLATDITLSSMAEFRTLNTGDKIVKADGIIYVKDAKGAWVKDIVTTGESTSYLQELYETDVTSTEFNYLDGVTSNIQTQLNIRTNLSVTHNSSNVGIFSSDGTDSTINAATSTKAGVMTDVMYNKLENVDVSNMVLQEDLADMVTTSDINVGELNSLNSTSTDYSAKNIYLDSKIYSVNDTDTYTEYHASNQWRVVVDGTEKLEVAAGLVLVGTDLTVTGTLTESSDRTLKENIETLTTPLDKVCSLRGVQFNKIDTPDINEIGFIAQEVQEVVPELVQENEGLLSVSYARTVSLLVEAMKEQSNIINNLKDRVQSLEEK